MKKLFFITLLIQFNFIQSDYSLHPRADFVINELVNSHGFEEEQVLDVLKKAKKQQTIIDRISTPAEFTITWDAYKNIFIEEKVMTHIWANKVLSYLEAKDKELHLHEQF